MKKTIKKLMKKIVPRKVYLFCKFLIDVIKSPLRHKNTADGNKSITIVYLLQFPEVWNSIKSVYYEGKNRGINSYVICIPKCSKDENNMKLFDRDVNEAYDFCKSNNIECIKADVGENMWFNIDSLEPTYVIYTRPYDELPEQYSCRQLTYKYKLCYIPYAYAMTERDLFHVTFPLKFIRNMSFVFVPNKSKLKLCEYEYYLYKKIRIL